MVICRNSFYCTYCEGSHSVGPTHEVAHRSPGLNNPCLPVYVGDYAEGAKEIPEPRALLADSEYGTWPAPSGSQPGASPQELYGEWWCPIGDCPGHAQEGHVVDAPAPAVKPFPGWWCWYWLWSLPMRQFMGAPRHEVVDLEYRIFRTIRLIAARLCCVRPCVSSKWSDSLSSRELIKVA